MLWTSYWVTLGSERPASALRGPIFSSANAWATAGLVSAAASLATALAFIWKRPQVPALALNPIVVVANYVFDSLSHDVFRIADGKLDDRWVQHSAEGGDFERDAHWEDGALAVKVAAGNGEGTAPHAVDPAYLETLGMADRLEAWRGAAAELLTASGTAA